MAALSLRIAVVVAVVFCAVSGDLQKSSLIKNELKRLQKSEVVPSKFWKLKGRAKDSLVMKEEFEQVKRGRAKEEMREKALEKLQEVFGVPGDVGGALRDNLRRRKHKHVPPLFMTELYREVADPYNGASKGAKPFGADVVRSYIERGSSYSDLLIFNISGLAPTEQVVEAEIHLYRMRSPARFQHGSGDNKSIPPYYLIRVYQALSNDTSLPVDSHRLLSVQHVSDISSPGWHVLNVREAVVDWIKGSRPNLGLIVTVSSPAAEGGERRHTKGEVRIARRNEHHNSRQPILVLFNSEGGKDSDDGERLRHPSRGYPNYYKRVHYDEGGEQLSESEERRRRASPLPEQARRDAGSQDSNATSAATTGECIRKDLFVDFEEIGWASWIISPKGYNSRHCLGHCDFPMGQGQNPTNHATVQSIVHELGLVRGVKKPSCVPSRLLPLSILYFDGRDNVVLKMFEDMIVESCGCH